MNTRFKTIVSIIVISFFLLAAGGSSDSEMNFYIVLIIFTVIAALVGPFISQSMRDSKGQEWKQKQIQEHGSATLEIKPTDDLANLVLVFDDKELLIVNKVTCNYADIIDFNINNQTSYRSSASTTSAFGRGVVGGVLFGGIGAIAGASTGSKNIQEDSTAYKVNITLRDMANPLLTFSTKDENAAQKLVSVLKNIIDRALKKEQTGEK